MPTESEVRAFLAASTRGPGKCLGTVGNDMTGHFGAYPVRYDTATLAADSLARTGELYTTPCPAAAHFDFYHYVETINGVRKDYGHIDYHVGALHYANSSRCTVYLNRGRTVGTYPSWGGTRRGWSFRPAAGDSMPPLGTSTASSGSHPISNPPTNRPTPQEDDEMPDNSGFYYPRSSDGATVRLILNTGNGFVSEYTSGRSLSTYDNGVAAAMHTGSYASITESHANALKAACAQVREAQGSQAIATAIAALGKLLEPAATTVAAAGGK